MAAPFHRVVSKVDRAICAYVASVGAGSYGSPKAAGDDVFPGSNSTDKVAPCTIVHTPRMTQVPLYSGNYMGEVLVVVKHTGAVDANQKPKDPQLSDDQRVGRTFDAFHIGGPLDDGLTLSRAINAAAYALAAKDPDNFGDLADFTVQNAIVKEIQQGQDGDHWVDTLVLEVYACPTVVDLG